MSGSRLRELRLGYQQVHGRAPRRTRYVEYTPPTRKGVRGWFRAWTVPEPLARSEWRAVKRAYKRSRSSTTPGVAPDVIRRMVAAGRKRDAAVERRRLARKRAEFDARRAA